MSSESSQDHATRSRGFQDASRGFQDTVRDFWKTRPVRPDQGGKVAGVAAAIGDRYGIDPVLPRIAFVVGTFYGGAGAVLYLMGWLFLPKEVDPGTDRRRHPPVAVAALFALLLLVAIAGMSWRGVFGLVIGLGAVYLLHRYRGQPVLSQATESATAPDGPTVEFAAPATPPDWDPLGAAPFAWDLPEPTPQEPEKVIPTRRRSVTVATLALAALAAILMVVTTPAPLRITLAVVLGVLGLGMIAGAFLRGGRGLIWFAIPIGVVALILNTISIGPWAGVHNLTESPSSISEVKSDYQVAVGGVALHLDHLRLAPGQVVRSNVETDLGSIRVYVPDDATVTARCSVDVGSAQCLGTRENGQMVREATTSAGTGGHLILNLTATVGSVEIIRD